MTPTSEAANARSAEALDAKAHAKKPEIAKIRGASIDNVRAARVHRFWLGEYVVEDSGITRH
jgi:hypothetical protein